MSCKPLISGVLLNLHKSIFVDTNYNYSITGEEWRRQFDLLQDIGCDLLFIFQGVSECMERTAVASDDLLEFLFSECDKRRMEIVISTDTRGAEKWDVNLDVKRQRSLIGPIIDKLYACYGSHASFRGWYLPFEFWVPAPDKSAFVRELLKSLTAKCKSLTPDLPVSISPFFMPDTVGKCSDFVYAEPERYVEYWSEFLTHTGIDVVALQDNGGQHLSCFSEQDTRPFIEAFAEACRNAGARLWGNVETGELPVADLDDCVRRYGAKCRVNNPDFAGDWRAVPIDRLIRKLELMSQFSERNVSWGYHEFYRPTLGNTHQAAYDAYYNYQRNL